MKALKSRIGIFASMRLPALANAALSMTLLAVAAADLEDRPGSIRRDAPGQPPRPLSARGLVFLLAEVLLTAAERPVEAWVGVQQASLPCGPPTERAAERLVPEIARPASPPGGPGPEVQGRQHRRVRDGSRGFAQRGSPFPGDSTRHETARRRHARSGPRLRPALRGSRGVYEPGPVRSRRAAVGRGCRPDRVCPVR